jgi:23S rRNA (uridine2552-2'-O)-methyltransferase
MVPNTTGICSVDQARSMALVEYALELSATLLAPGGRFVVKIFEGGDFKAYLERAKEIFKDVKVRRPKGTRVGSIETYVVGLGCLGAVAADAGDATIEEEESP